MKRALLATLAITALLACSAVAPAATIKRGAINCPQKTKQGPFGNETVLKTRHMSCETARRVVKNHDQQVDISKVNVEGSRYRLGSFRCTVVHTYYESAKAGCRDGQRFFKLDYGY